jgi:DNA-binding MurR/RpiR family transcriptional regulator
MNQFDYQRAIMASNLTPSERLVAIVIGSHVNWKNQEAAFPSVATICKESGLSNATVHRAKQSLVSQGYLVSQRHFNKSNTYLVMIPEALTMREGSLTVIDAMSHSVELKENITENRKENIKENEDSNESFKIYSQQEVEEMLSW